MWRKDQIVKVGNAPLEPEGPATFVLGASVPEWHGAEQGMLERLYRREIEHTLVELDALTRGFQGEVDSRMAAHVRDTLNVLSACYKSSALTTQALDVLAQHLRTLLQALKQDYANTFS